MPEYDVVIVGAGAAGMVCGVFAAQRGLRVLLLEKMERPGRKLLITGKGRCNLTNACAPEELMESVRTNSKFLYSALTGFNAQDTMDAFTGWGVPLKIERGNRVFPSSDRSADIVDALVRALKKEGAVLRRSAVRDILVENGRAVGVLTESGERVLANNVLLATGGMSYPLTGSTGDGYRMAAKTGHTIVPVGPSLIPIVTRETWCRELMGLSLRNVTLRLVDPKGRIVYKELGEMLFTHFGVSGPLVLSASSHITGSPAGWEILVDLKPGLTEDKLDERLLRDFQKYNNRDFPNALTDLLPRKLIPIVVRLSSVPSDQKVRQITKKQRLELVFLLKNLRISLREFRPIEEAVITSGGVSTKEINPKTMESKLVERLYFAGELIDVDAYTGGFNLQIAFSTAYMASQGFSK